MQAAALHYEDRRSAESWASELSDSRLGMSLIETLRIAKDIQDRADKRYGAAVENLRQRHFRQTAIEKLAEALLNIVGDPDDCALIRQFAEEESER